MNFMLNKNIRKKGGAAPDTVGTIMLIMIAVAVFVGMCAILSSGMSLIAAVLLTTVIFVVIAALERLINK